jgi:F420-non-reducing hydrogenase small subunit
MADKLKVGAYWAASCGGCDVSTLDIHEKVLDLIQHVDFVFWPVAMDFKYKDVEAMEDDYMDLCLFNGAIRNSENEHMAKLLRKKSKVLVAFGSCAHTGGIPGLANFHNREEIFQYVYRDSPSVTNPEGVVPQQRYEVDEGEIEIPEFYNTVKSLDQTVDVDYYVPGCPPAPHQIWAVLNAVLTGELPPKGSVVGAEDRALCEECPREIAQRCIKGFVRPHEVIAEPDKCFMEQGMLCMGSATRAGCGARCIKSNLPCRGCYGPTSEVVDQGAKITSAIASVMEADEPEAVNKILETLPDPAGYFYRFGLAKSLFHRRLNNAPADPEEK